MIFSWVYMLVMFGLLLSSMAGLVPASSQQFVPDFLRFIMFVVGFIIAFLGIALVHGRATKTGAVHLLEFGRPGTIIWFYFHKDGTVKVTPAVREVEGTTYSKEMDALVNDVKSYRLFDHSIRIVPEALGSSVDLDMVLYTTLLRTKHGFVNLREARKGNMSIPKEKISKEYYSLNPGKDFGEVDG